MDEYNNLEKFVETLGKRLGESGKCVVRCQIRGGPRSSEGEDFFFEASCSSLDILYRAHGHRSHDDERPKVEDHIKGLEWNMEMNGMKGRILYDY